jgi:hypothetical protein
MFSGSQRNRNILDLIKQIPEIITENRIVMLIIDGLGLNKLVLL